MVKIIFESHSTSFDNEAHICSGWKDVDLSPLGEQQSQEMGQRYKDENFDAIFCSDLVRSVRTGEIAFAGRFPIMIDKRLRECNYGELNGAPSSQVDAEKIKRINVPFDGGESYLQTSERMKSFIDDLTRDFDGKRVMIIGHAATRYGLEHLILGKSYKEIISAPWQWQPGWKYQTE